jgi:hypothetical protein
VRKKKKELMQLVGTKATKKSHAKREKKKPVAAVIE